jgi:hypothetical protein
MSAPSSNPPASAGSGWGGLLSKAKFVASSVAAVTQAAVAQGVESSKRTYAEMKAQPTM